MAGDLLFDSDDLIATEDFLGQAYSKTRISATGAQTPAHVERRWHGRVSVDRLKFGFDMSYDSAPLHRVCLSRVLSGTIEKDVVDQPRELAPGDVSLFCQPELPDSGRVCGASYDLLMFDAALLDRVAGSEGEQVRLLGYRPTSDEAALQLSATIEFVRALAYEGPPASRLVAAATATMLASVVLSTLPNTANSPAPRPADRSDTLPVLLRRAVAFLEANASAAIVLSDVAETAHVTPRALQYMFRRHLDMTPMQYLRRVRLDHAHQELIDADPATTSVRHIANEWGFAHTGRFAAMYRRAYDRMPSDTLRY